MDPPVLSTDAKAVLRRAREIALDHGSDRADHADILAAALRMDLAIRLLELFGADPPKVQAGVAFLSPGLTSPIDSSREERVVARARSEAALLGQNEAGPEHLIVALVDQGDSFASRILQSFGLTLDSTREAVRFLHGQGSDWRAPQRDESSAASSPAPMEHLSGPAPQRPFSVHDVAIANFDVGNSPLDRVIGIGQAARSSGVLVEMIALEVRSSGAVLLWRTQTAEERILGPAIMTISDDAGTKYEVFQSSWGGSGRESRGETRLRPQPGKEARSLVIEVLSFGHFGLMDPPAGIRTDQREVAGPWRFEVSLRR